MGETLEEGLNALFGSGAAQTRTSVEDSVNTVGVSEQAVTGAGAAPSIPLAAPSAETARLLQEAQTHYDRAIAAQRSGNWADYGREIDALGATLRSLAAQKR
jgi:uncharacterized membrane protein (UPF0182 family)